MFPSTDCGALPLGRLFCQQARESGVIIGPPLPSAAAFVENASNVLEPADQLLVRGMAFVYVPCGAGRVGLAAPQG